MSKVTIIMPLYNKADTVERSIKSIQYQNETDWHLIIVDDGSTDNSAEVVRQIRDDRVELIQQENQGAGPARNTGIAHTKTKYLAFLDADDEWYPWYLKNALHALHHNDVALAASLYYQWPQQTDMTQYWAQRKVTEGIYSMEPDDDPYKVTNLIRFLLPWNCVMLTDVARKHGGFYDCIYGEDRVFFIRVAFAERFMIIGPPAVRYHNECSGILNERIKKYLEEWLVHPNIVLDYCPPEKRDLMLQFFDAYALISAQYWAGQRMRLKTIKLLRKYPGTKKLGSDYYNCVKKVVPGYWTWQIIKRKLFGSSPSSIKKQSVSETLSKEAAPPSMPYE